MATDTLLDALEQRHEIWKQNIETWKEIEEVLYDHVKLNLKNYIVRGEDEEPTDYSKRLKFARFKGELSPVIGRLVGAVMGRPPSRPERLVNEWKDFIENCDGCQTHLDQFLEDRLFEAFGFGASCILIDRPAVDANGVSLERTFMGFEQVVNPRRVDPSEIIAVPYRIDQVVDWAVDRCGEFHWIRLLEKVTRSSDPLAKSESIEVYREFDRSSWRTFEVRIIDGERRAEPVDSGDHNLGMVPLIVLGLQKERAMSFYSPMRYAYQHDIANFVADSDLQFAMWRFAHPTILDYTSEDMKTRVTVGPGAVVKRNPNQLEDMKLLEVTGEGLQQLRRSKEEAVEGLRRISGVDPLSGSKDPQASGASGRSRSLSFSVSEQRHLRRASRALSGAERRIFEIAERWVDPRSEIGVTERLNEDRTVYPMVFTSTETESLIEQWLSTRTAINSEIYDRQMQIKIMDSALGDVGSELREKIIAEIEENELLARDVPAPGGPIQSNLSMEVPTPESKANSEAQLGPDGGQVGRTNRIVANNGQ